VLTALGCAEQDDPKQQFIRAVRNNDRATVERLLAAGVSVGTRDSDNPDARAALFHAALFGYNDLVKLLLAKGADINGAPGAPVPTPLMGAASQGNATTVAILIEAGAEVGRRDPATGSTALAEAASRGSLETVRLLLQAGADPNLPLNDGRSPLCLARKGEFQALSDLLRDNGAAEPASCP
jgi:hypothetical protein